MDCVYCYDGICRNKNKKGRWFFFLNLKCKELTDEFYKCDLKKTAKNNENNIVNNNVENSLEYPSSKYVAEISPTTTFLESIQESSIKVNEYSYGVELKTIEDLDKEIDSILNKYPLTNSNSNLSSNSNFSSLSSSSISTSISTNQNGFSFGSNTIDDIYDQPSLKSTTTLKSDKLKEKARDFNFSNSREIDL